MPTNAERTIHTCPQAVVDRYKAARGEEGLLDAERYARAWLQSIRKDLAVGDIIRLPHPLKGEPMIELYYDGSGFTY